MLGWRNPTPPKTTMKIRRFLTVSCAASPNPPTRRSLGYLALAGLSAAVALGQTPPPPTSTGSADTAPVQLDTFIVSGISGGLANASNIKRKADVIVDAISAESIGSFPDNNVAESLQRIPGVQIERDRGEGTEVSVDGLDPKFNFETFNGRVLSSATGSRAFDFRLFDPTFIEAITVYKTPSADLLEGALSATIDLATLRPLDLGVRRVVVNLGANYEANSNRWSANPSLLYSDVLPGGKFGFSFGASYTQRSMQTYSFNGYGMDPYAHPTYLVPNANYYNDDVETRTRQNYVATLQFKPSSIFEATIDLLYARLLTNDVNYNDALRYDNSSFDGPVTSTGITVVNGQNYATTLSETNIDYRNNGRDDINDWRTYSLGASFKLKPSDRIEVTGGASYTNAQQLISSLGLETIGAASATYNAPLGQIPTTTFTAGFDPLNPNGFLATSYNGSYKEPITDKNYDGRLDAKLKLGWGALESLQFGVRGADRDNEQRSNQLTVPASTLAQLLGVPLISNTAAGPAISAAPFVGLVRPSSSSFFSGYVPTPWLAFQQANLFARVSQNALLKSTPLVDELANDFGVKEATLAEYFRLNLKASLFGLPLSGNLGLRAVTTNQTSSGYAPNLNNIVFSQAGASTSVPDVTPSLIKRSYTDWLPSLNTKLDVTNAFDLRFGAARVMSRPDLSLLSTGTSVNANVYSITSNNPNLKPYYANQFNLSAEYALGTGGLASVNGFYKQIQSFITTETTYQPLNVKIDTGGSETLNFAHSFPANGNGADLKGVELGYQQRFTFLPAPFNQFGMQANYTYVDAGSIKAVAGGPSLALTGVSRNSYNVAGYYECKWFNVRLAYDYRDGFLVDPSSYFGDGVYTESLGVLDGTFRFKVTQNVSVYFNANNITNAYLKQRTIYNVLRLVEDDGRRYTAGVRLEF